MNNSLDMLSDSLDQKIAILREIEQYNEAQRIAFESEGADMTSFDEAIEKKDELIERLTKLDDGFQALYDRIAVELEGNRERYASKIRELQGKITKVTELSISIQASEARNKKLVEQYFANERKSIKKGRVGSKAAYGYYRNMSGANVQESQFLDSKK